ncbi:16S rRNA (guanine(527)-N(7))-methyltransferase RsmG [Gammaproteobacteria bacterium]|jgi:16S rRNA (guanine527-N7)-methyltransferase|nr:16S rRNA (guanine(527)-N(7))-methyltransferase RsmG [Gammaproteobacteria bacterium]
MESTLSLTEQLKTGLSSLDLDLDNEKVEQLVQYLQLLDKWNKAYNLSGIKEVQRMVAYHLLDSLAIVPHIDGNIILDVGTGAGLPGIPLAICFPEKRFLLLDSNGKKTRFLFQVKMELGLDNVEVFHNRLETFQSQEQIDIVLCRAYATLAKVVSQCGHLMKADCRLLAMKGQFPEEEIVELPASFRFVKTNELNVPGVDGTRHLIEIVPVSGQ